MQKPRSRAVSTDDGASDGNDSPGFASFLITEYDNLAQAHFKMVETISEFFKHYLTVISIPLALIILVLNLDLLSVPAASSSTVASPVVFILLLAVALVGLMMFLYVLNLRMDALLYARAINGIRKHFYDIGSATPFSTRVRMRVLPQSPQIPNYREFRYFGPVVVAFAILDSFYFLLALGWLSSRGDYVAGVAENPVSLSAWWVWLGMALFILAHYAGYRYVTSYRESSYLRSNIIGVDIDGVLNKHRGHFCRMLKEARGIIIKPERITTIPVHNCKGLRVSREDEIAVFNTPQYWTEMPPDPEAGDFLNRLKNALNMKVEIFTSRPWPAASAPSEAVAPAVKDSWSEETRRYAGLAYRGRPASRLVGRAVVAIRTIAWQKLPEKYWRIGWGRERDPIVLLTKWWLQSNRIPYDRLILERAGEDISDPRSAVRNRFQVSRQRQIRFFVEDDLQKARKLAFICDVVFLLDHPYNQVGELPSNVMRVESWRQIYEEIKELG